MLKPAYIGIHVGTCKKNVTLASERYMAEFLYIKLGYWFIQNPCIAMQNQYACILHDTSLEFCQATEFY